MKKILLLILAVAVSASVCRAQEQPARVVSNHSFNVKTTSAILYAGAGYTYELALGQKFSVLGSAWLMADFVSPFFKIEGVLDKDTYLLLQPAVSIEPRFYYNMSKRAARGRNTNLNSANFLSANFDIVFPSIYGTDGVERDFTFLLITPQWGMRRVYKSGFMFEFNAGASFLFADGLFDWVPAIGLKLGYAF